MPTAKQVAVIVVLVAVGVWALRSFAAADDKGDDGAPSDPTPTAPNTSSTTAGGPVIADRFVAGIPVGYPHTATGAATAAVNWVASFPTIVRMGPIRLDDTIRQLLSQELAQRGTDEVIADYFTLFDTLGSDFTRRVWIESPLQANSVADSPDRVEVAVWASLVTGDATAGPVEVVWRTHHIALVWERDDWRIDNITISEGPTPIPADTTMPSPAVEFGDVDTWEPAVFADTTTGVD